MNKNNQQSLDIKAQAFMSRLKIQTLRLDEDQVVNKELKNNNYNIFLNDKFREKQTKLF